MPSPPREPCIWRTSWPAGRASRSNTHTAALTAPARWPRWWRPRWVGPPRTSSVRSPITPRGWRPKYCRRPSPTTCRPTSGGPAPPRHAPKSSSRCRSADMTAKSAPLPVRDGLGPARVRLHGGPVLAELTARFGPHARAKVLAGEVVDADGVVVDDATMLPTGYRVYLYRDLPHEVPVPFDVPVLYQDADIVDVDKPHFLATIPRGQHVAQTALVRLRRELRLPELSPAHRLDRLTAGVLLFTTRRELRGAYQTLFARGLVRKTYLAWAAVDPDLVLPRVVRSRIVKRRGHLQATCEPGVPNAETLVERISEGSYRLKPSPGRTHKLRVRLASLGLPIEG